MNKIILLNKVVLQETDKNVLGLNSTISKQEKKVRHYLASENQLMRTEPQTHNLVHIFQSANCQRSFKSYFAVCWFFLQRYASNDTNQCHEIVFRPAATRKETNNRLYMLRFMIRADF